MEAANVYRYLNDGNLMYKIKSPHPDMSLNACILRSKFFRV